MNALQTAISLKLTPLVYDVLQKDGDHEYGLKEDVPYGVIHTKHFPAFDYEDDVLKVTKVSKWRSRWLIKSFEPGQGLFDGTSLLPDKGTRSLDAIFKAALFHDVVYKRVEAISKATGIPQDKIFAFADDVFKLLADGYGADKRLTSVIHTLVRFGGSLYHKVMKALALLTILLGSSSCYTIQTELEDPPPQNLQITGPFKIHERQDTERTEQIPQKTPEPNPRTP